MEDDYVESPGLAKLEDMTAALMAVDVPAWYRNPDFQILFKRSNDLRPNRRAGSNDPGPRVGRCPCFLYPS
jgi:hypothetical protein